MTTKVQKWGNSLAVRIPKIFVERYNLSNGSNVVLKETDKGALIVPIMKKRQKINLKDALANFDIDMIEAVNWGESIGKEKLTEWEKNIIQKKVK